MTAEINQNSSPENNSTGSPETALNIAEGDGNPEAVKNPETQQAEQHVETALNIIEGDDKSDVVLNSEWIKKAKDFTIKYGKAGGRAGGSMAGILSVAGIGAFLNICSGLIKGLYNLGNKVAGNMGGKPSSLFSEGSKIGEEMFSQKKEKKKE